MVRRLLRAGSVLSLIACLALVGMWIRSYRHADRIHGRIWGPHSFVIASKQGRVTTVAFRWEDTQFGRMRPLEVWQWALYSFPSDQRRSFPAESVRTYESGLGFDIIDRPWMVVPFASPPPAQQWYVELGQFLNGTGLMVPYWFLVLLSGALAGLLKWGFHWQFSLRGALVAVTFIAAVLGLVAALDLSQIGLLQP